MSFPPGKHGCRIEKTKRPRGSQCGADGRDRAVEVVDVGEAETAGRPVEIMGVQEFRRCHVSVDITDAERLVLFGLPGFPDQVS